MHAARTGPDVRTARDRGTLVASVVSACALASGCAAPQVDARGEATAQESSAWEQMHASVADRVRRAANWVDSFLSDERALAEENRSWVSVRGAWSIEEHAQGELDGEVRARLVLPHTEERLHVALLGDSDTEADASTAPLDPLAGAGDATQPSDLGLQYFVRDTRSNNVRLEVGSRFEELVPKPYVGARWRHTEPLGVWQARATERLRVYTDDGFESKTTLDLERTVGDARLFRATSRLVWAEEDAPAVDYGERLSLFQRVDERCLVTFELDAALTSQPVNVLEALTARVRVSHRYDHGRILFDVAPQVAWRDEDGHEPVPGLVLGLEIAFGRDDRAWSP